MLLNNCLWRCCKINKKVILKRYNPIFFISLQLKNKLINIIMKTFKFFLVLVALFAFIACGNSTVESSDEDAAIENQQVKHTNTDNGSFADEISDSGQAEKSSSDKKPTASYAGSDKPVQLNKQLFLERVFNYEENPREWEFRGERPCIIDFYADWCGPCKKVAPIMDQLAKEYEGKIDIYKIDTDKQKELAQVFNIRSIPSVMYCPAEGQPYMYVGAFPKSKYQELIKKHFESIN